MSERAASAPAVSTAPGRAEVPRWREVVAGRRGGITLGLCVIELLAGMQMLITSATMPKVLDAIGGIEFYGWVFSGYSLAGLAAIPRAGRDADRHGAFRPLAEMMAIFAAGTILCGVAPSMILLAAARLVQGYGGGGLYTIAYGVVAKVYPERVRARVLALLTLVWVVSGLVAPAIGVAIANTAGWRWSFLVSIPLVALSAALVLPRIAATPGDPSAAERMPLRPPFELAAGVGLAVAALSTPAWWSTPVGLIGAAMIAHSLPHLLPVGTYTARPGLPAAVALAFLTGVGFFTADSYVTLLLTGVSGRTYAEAGVAVTLVSVSWSLSSWWQSRAVVNWSHAGLLRLGAVLLAAGVAGTAAALVDAPLLLVYTAWFVAGLGMGIAYPTLLIASMGTSEAGDEATVVAARMLGGRLAMSFGTGVGGVSVALGAAAGASLRAGLAGTFGLALAASIAAVALAGRVR